MIKKIRPSSLKNKRKIFVHPELRKCRRMYIKVDCMKLPSKDPYDGPFEVVNRNKKYCHICQIQFSDHQDKLKYAFELSEEVYGHYDEPDQ